MDSRATAAPCDHAKSNARDPCATSTTIRLDERIDLSESSPISRETVFVGTNRRIAPFGRVALRPRREVLSRSADRRVRPPARTYRRRRACAAYPRIVGGGGGWVGIASFRDRARA